MEESACHEMVIYLSQRFSRPIMLCVLLLLFFLVFFVVCFFHVFINNAPAMIMAGALSVTPVRPSVRTLRTYVCPDDVRSLTGIFFYQNFMKLGHIVKYHDVFIKFDNGPYRARFSRVMALCL